MIRRRFTLALAAATLAAASGCSQTTAGHLPPPPDPGTVAKSDAVAKVAAANTDFTFRLLNRLTSQDPGKNVFISPYSITNALSVLMNGAAGKTHTEIKKTLGLGSTPTATVNGGNQLLLPSLSDPDPKVKLSIANAIWASKGRFSNSFKQKVARYYNAGATDLDLSSPSAADTINKWVSDNTQGKIDQIVSPNDLTNATTVITNAVYFHGQWSKQFDKSSTQNAPFHHEDGSVKTVPMMADEDDVKYTSTKQFQAFELPYGAERISFYVILPTTGTKLADIINRLDAKSWEKTVKSMNDSYIELSLPRFEAEYTTTLNKPLIDMGMPSAFGSGADLSPMGAGDSYVSEICHKALIDVDEEGTTAAAATDVLTEVSARMPGATVRVDHPFFCAIRDNLTGTILFAGAIYDPQPIN